MSEQMNQPHGGRGQQGEGVQLDPVLLEMLACPNCHSRLAVDHDHRELICSNPECSLAFPVVDQIPVLLVDDARKV